MTENPIRQLDVRPILAAGGEPFALIMQAVRALPPGTGLRLIAPFPPMPLRSVMARHGFEAAMCERDDGGWEVLFTPLPPPPDDPARLAPGSTPEAMFWPDPLRTLDLLGLAPPAPRARILAALEAMAPGEVLFALMGREPLDLLPVLAAQGDEWAGNFAADGRAYRLLVRRGDRG